MRKLSLLIGLVLLVHGVFGVGEITSVSVSVMVGDSVTLHTDLTEAKRFDELQWEIQGENYIIAQIDREADEVSVPGNEEERFRDRLKLDHQTGFLTITNIRTTDSGDYQLKIKSSEDVNKYIFSVTVHGEMNTVSVMEGGLIILLTGLYEIREYNQILWKFDDHLIAEINEVANRFLTHDSSAGGKFKGRLQLHRQSGDLTISDSRTTDSGVYHLNMISSSHTVQRRVSVTVSSDRSGSVSGISGASVGLMVWTVAVFLLREV